VAFIQQTAQVNWTLDARLPDTGCLRRMIGRELLGLNQASPVAQ
jgi:hypothetical protein